MSTLRIKTQPQQLPVWHLPVRISGLQKPSRPDSFFVLCLHSTGAQIK